MNGGRSLSGLLGRELVEAFHAAFDRCQEALLFGARRVDDVLGALAQLRIDVAQLVDDDAHDRRQRRLAAAEQPGVSNCAAQNAPQYVTSAFVGWKDSIREEYRYG